MIYLLVLILLFFLICRYDIVGDNRHRNFWYYFVLLLFISIAGLRYRLGGDTVNYLEIYYHETHSIFELTFDDIFSSEMEPLYVLLTSIVKTLGGKFYWVQMIQAVIVNGLIFSYFRKYSDCIFTCIFLYALWAYTLFCFEEMRASISLALCLFANDYYLEKKWLKGLSLYVIGCLFHYSTLLLLLTPLFMFLKFNFVGMLFVILALPAGVFAELMLGDYLMLLDMGDQISDKAIGYINNDEFHQKYNIYYYIVDIGIYIFFVFVSFLYVKCKHLRDEILKFQPFLIFGMIFFMAKTNFGILTRYAHFYYPYFIIFISMMFVYLIKNNLNQMKSIAWIRTLVIFSPFLYLLARAYIASPPRMISKSYHNYQKYYPYSSVIEKNVNKDREKLYDNLYSVTLRHSVVQREEY